MAKKVCRNSDLIPVWLALGDRWTDEEQVPDGFVRIGLTEPPPSQFVFIYSLEGQQPHARETMERGLGVWKPAGPVINVDKFWRFWMFDGWFSSKMWDAVRRLWAEYRI